jgi:hypothetical protein
MEVQGDYNLRQLKLMMLRIEEYEKKLISLGKLINDLEALLDCLENFDQEWIKRFNKISFMLEYINAFALSEGKNILDAEEQEEINLTLTILKEILREKLR